MELETITGTGIRYHHYIFAQYVMLNYVLNHPLQSLEMFGTMDNEYFATKHLKTIWYQVYAQIKDMEKVPFEGISYSAHIIDRLKTLIVFTLPKPQYRTESYYIGIYYQLSDEKVEPEIRYFTLEYHDEKESALCELQQGHHSIHDLSDTLSKEEFIEAIKKIV